MKAPLHQHAGATHLLGLGDLLVDFLEGENVAFVGAWDVFSFFGQRAVERAEGAVLGAEVGVVDVAIDDVGDYALGVEAAAHGVGLEAQADEVRGVEMVESLLACQRHLVHSTNLQVWGRARETASQRFLLLRKRKSPRLCTGSGRVRDRFEAVEIPLKRTKKSQNARRKFFLPPTVISN